MIKKLDRKSSKEIHVKKKKNWRDCLNPSDYSILIRESNLGVEGLRMTFDSFVIDEDNKLAREYCYRWVYDSKFRKIVDKLGIVLYGPTRTGKTHLACAIANELIKNGILCRMCKTVSIPRHNSDLLNELICIKVNPFLILDDLGAEKLTDRALECLYGLIDGRVWSRAPLILTTNYNEAELARILNEGKSGAGDRLVNRLTDFCNWVFVGGSVKRRGLK